MPWHSTNISYATNASCPTMVELKAACQTRTNLGGSWIYRSWSAQNAAASRSKSAQHTGWPILNSSASSAAQWRSGFAGNLNFINFLFFFIF